MTIPNYVRVVFLKSSRKVTTMPFDRLSWELLPPQTCFFEDLPEWMQGRLASLMLIEPGAEGVPGVGKRISKRIFWVDTHDARS